MFTEPTPLGSTLYALDQWNGVLPAGPNTSVRVPGSTFEVDPGGLRRAIISRAGRWGNRPGLSAADSLGHGFRGA